jgi:hypothetical protein
MEFVCFVPLSYPVTGAEMQCFPLSDYTAILHCDMFLFTTYREVVTTCTACFDTMLSADTIYKFILLKVKGKKVKLSLYLIN